MSILRNLFLVTTTTLVLLYIDLDQAELLKELDYGGCWWWYYFVVIALTTWVKNSIVIKLRNENHLSLLTLLITIRWMRHTYTNSTIKINNYISIFLGEIGGRGWERRLNNFHFLLCLPPPPYCNWIGWKNIIIFFIIFSSFLLISYLCVCVSTLNHHILYDWIQSIYFFHFSSFPNGSKKNFFL